MAATSSLSLRWMACASLFWARWMRNTIRKVTMVVLVLMTSCQVSEKAKKGPLTSQMMIESTASPNAAELPDQSVARRESRARKGSRGGWLALADMGASGWGRAKQG